VGQGVESPGHRTDEGNDGPNCSKTNSAYAVTCVIISEDLRSDTG
jgi:hypothetical protein